MSEYGKGHAALEPSDLDRIAAYLEGTLTGSERALVERLLATSEAAREVLAEGARLRDELEGALDPVVPGRGRRVGWRVWVPLVAAAAAAVALFPGILDRRTGDVEPGAIILSALDAGTLPRQLDWGEQSWSRVRGVTPDDRANAAFRAGVRWTDVLAAYQAGDVERARTFSAEILDLLEQVPLSAPASAEVRAFVEGEVRGDGGRTGGWSRAAGRVEVALGQALGRDVLELAMWVEGARLAALSGDETFFHDPRVLGALAALAAGDWPGEVRERLQELSAGAAAPAPRFAELREAAESLIGMLGG